MSVKAATSSYSFGNKINKVSNNNKFKDDNESVDDFNAFKDDEIKKNLAKAKNLNGNINNRSRASSLTTSDSKSSKFCYF
jgi:hypothetical protein